MHHADCINETGIIMSHVPWDPPFYLLAGCLNLLNKLLFFFFSSCFFAFSSSSSISFFPYWIISHKRLKLDIKFNILLQADTLYTFTMPSWVDKLLNLATPSCLVKTSESYFCDETPNGFNTPAKYLSLTMLPSYSILSYHEK